MFFPVICDHSRTLLDQLYYCKKEIHCSLSALPTVDPAIDAGTSSSLRRFGCVEITAISSEFRSDDNRVVIKSASLCSQINNRATQQPAPPRTTHYLAPSTVMEIPDSGPSTDERTSSLRS